MKNKRITEQEQLIARAGLTKNETRIARFLYDLPSAGRRTKRWVADLSARKYSQLSESVEEKIRKVLEDEETRGSGK